MSFTEYQRRGYALYGYIDYVHTPYGDLFTNTVSTGYLLRVIFSYWE